MAMVLSSRYATARDFYVSRIMRIFPTYWLVLAGTAVLSTTCGLLFDQWLLLKPYLSHPLDRNGATGFLLTAFSNFTLIGQDWVMFWSHDFGRQIHFTEDFRNDTSPLYHYLLVPQSWSVGVELTFYAFAPYLNRMRSRQLALIAFSALAARLFGYWRMGLAHDPWDYRFSPFEISLFLFGMLGYRLYARKTLCHPSQRFRCVTNFSYLVAFPIFLLLLYVHAKGVGYIGRIAGNELGALITYPFWILGIPVLFFAFGNHKLDRIIGELSYPIYLIHFTVMAFMSILLPHLRLGARMGMIDALVSIIAAGILYCVFIAPIDKKRHSLSQKYYSGI